MSRSLDEIERAIARERDALNDWLAEMYAGQENQRHCGELDAGYPGWDEIETLLGVVFDHGLSQELSDSAIDSLLFFISRSDEMGAIIAWLSPFAGSPFSWCGSLSYADFLFLSDQALRREEDYCDYQLVACFRKRESLDDRAIDALNRFFKRRDSYTRRMALDAFVHFARPESVELAKELWRTDDCEFAKLSCLYALKEFPDASLLFDAYLRDYQVAFDVDAQDYRRTHLRRLTSRGDQQDV